MSDTALQTFDRLIQEPHGIVLVTGPTGSGKSTTLYAALTRLNSTTTNILTVEDPIEYELPGVGQTQVNPRIDMSFAKALRAILRQDPDIIMIGEIRDLETAQIAVQASLTGHLVLATLHTNDAAAAVTRLLDMGIEPFLLSSSLLGVVAQRLIRTLCPNCKIYDGEKWEAIGCPKCGHTGFLGRVGIYEILEVDERIRGQIHDRAPEAEIRATAQLGGMRTMREDGQRWVEEGVTTEAELMRVTAE
jgi:general secretion pathway protein E